MARISSETRIRPADDAPVEVQIMGTDFLEIVRARDIGFGGVGVWIPHGFAGCNTSIPVEIVVTLPGRKSFLVQGQIRHHTQRGASREVFGVQFLSLTGPQRKAIKAYVVSRAEDDPGSILR